MKKLTLVFSVLILISSAIIFFSQRVNAQTKENDSEKALAVITTRLEKIETQLETVLDNQQKMLVELRRGRYFTTHRA